MKVNKYFLGIIISMIGFHGLAAPKSAKVTFFDGYEIEGYADITKKNKIEFRLEFGDTPDVYDQFDIKRVDFLEDPIESFEYVAVLNSGFKLLKIISEGTIVAYVQTPESFSTQKTARQLAKEDYINGEFINRGSYGGNGGYSVYQVKGIDGKTYNFTGSLFGDKQPIFFIKRKQDVQAKNIKLGFKKKAIKFFNDCPDLVDIIENKEWKYVDMRNIVDYYNEMCSK